jgi:hypothetical protein
MKKNIQIYINLCLMQEKNKNKICKLQTISIKQNRFKDAFYMCGLQLKLNLEMQP